MMTLGDLMGGLKGLFSPSPAPAPTTANLPQLQAQYQRYAEDAMTRGQQPVPFQAWVAAQQQQAPQPQQ